MRGRVAAVGLVALAIAPTGAAKPRDGIPSWLPGRERETVVRVFGSAPLVATFHIPYVHTIAVVFEFQRVVVCRACSAPSNEARPRGRVVRVSFDRRTHRLTGSMRFCEARGVEPPLSACLTR